MLKILLSGACGRMGRQVAGLAEEEQAVIAAGVVFMIPAYTLSFPAALLPITIYILPINDLLSLLSHLIITESKCNGKYIVYC